VRLLSLSTVHYTLFTSCGPCQTSCGQHKVHVLPDCTNNKIALSDSNKCPWMWSATDCNNNNDNHICITRYVEASELLWITFWMIKFADVGLQQLHFADDSAVNLWQWKHSWNNSPKWAWVSACLLTGLQWHSYICSVVYVAWLGGTINVVHVLYLLVVHKLSILSWIYSNLSLWASHTHLVILSYGGRMESWAVLGRVIVILQWLIICWTTDRPGTISDILVLNFSLLGVFHFYIWCES